jgi:hypothetical protein
MRMEPGGGGNERGSLMNRGLSPRLRGDFVSQLIRVTRVEDANSGGVR